MVYRSLFLSIFFFVFCLANVSVAQQTGTGVAPPTEASPKPSCNAPVCSLDVYSDVVMECCTGPYNAYHWCQDFSLDFTKQCKELGLNCPPIALICIQSTGEIGEGHAINAVQIGKSWCLIEPQTGEVYYPCAETISEIPKDVVCKILGKPAGCNCDQIDNISQITMLNGIPLPPLSWFMSSNLITNQISKPLSCVNNSNGFLNCTKCCDNAPSYQACLDAQNSAGNPLICDSATKYCGQASQVCTESEKSSYPCIVATIKCDKFTKLCQGEDLECGKWVDECKLACSTVTPTYTPPDECKSNSGLSGTANCINCCKDDNFSNYCFYMQTMMDKDHAKCQALRKICNDLKGGACNPKKKSCQTMIQKACVQDLQDAGCSLLPCQEWVSSCVAYCNKK